MNKILVLLCSLWAVSLVARGSNFDTAKAAFESSQALRFDSPVPDGSYSGSCIGNYDHSDVPSHNGLDLSRVNDPILGPVFRFDWYYGNQWWLLREINGDQVGVRGSDWVFVRGTRQRTF